MILLDTNILSELMRVDVSKRVLDWLDLQVTSSLFICAITRAEIMKLATRNTKDFLSIEALELINPWEKTGSE